MKFLSKILFAVSLSFTFLAPVSFAYAACEDNFVSSTPCVTQDTDGSVQLINPLGETDPRIIIGNLIKAILSIVGSVTLLMFVYGGVLWITSMGEEKKVQKGKQILVWGVAGLAVIAGSYVLVNAIITGLTTGTAT